MISFCTLLKSEPSFFGEYQNVEYYYLEDLLCFRKFENIVWNNLDFVEDMIEMIVVRPGLTIS